MRYALILLLIMGCSSDPSSTEVEIPEIGDEYGGGIVISTHNEQYVWVVSKTNQSEGIKLTCNAPHDGNQSQNGWINTRNLAEKCGDDTGAHLVWNISLNGYDDWYIPGKGFLEWVYESQDQTGVEIGNAKYWSSACDIDNCTKYFYWVDFSDGANGYSFRDSTYKIRAIRKDTLN